MTNYQSQFAKLPNTHAWLQNKRQQAFAHFEKIGFPNLRDEAWKYTNIKPLLNREFGIPTIKQVELNTLPLSDTNCHQLFFVNGHYLSEKSKGLPENIAIKNLATAIKELNPDIEKYLSHLTNNIPHGFAALNMAFTQEGAYIKIPRDTSLTQPIHLIYITTENNISYYPRNLIIAEPNSQTTIIESYLSVNASNYFTNAITEIYLQPGSKVEHIKIQQEQESAFHIATTQVEQTQDSQFNSHVYSFGAGLSRTDTNIALAGTGASCDLSGLYLCHGKQHMDHHTQVNHLKAHCTSREFYKGILDNFSRAVFNGQVIVHPHAHHTDAQQSNKNLLLSKHAEIDTKPQLEIYNDDVKCTHGATVGQLDDMQLFYLCSRGIDEAMAKTMLTDAFASEILEKITNLELKKYIHALVLQSL